MPTIEGLQKVANLNKTYSDASQNYNRLDAAKQAASLFQSGDIKGALSTMAKVDPEHVAGLIQTFQQGDPASIQGISQAQTQGGTQGQYNVTTPAGANPRQLLDAQLAGQLAIAKTKADQPKPSDIAVRNDPNSPTGFSLVNKKTGEKVNANQAGLPQHQGEPLNLRPNEDINSKGEKVMLSPDQQKTIKETRKTFEADTKDIVKGIEAGHQALVMIEKNIPGSEALEKIRVLRSVAQARINTQEFQQYGKDMGLFNTAENQLSKVGGKGMSPEVQGFMRAVASTAMKTSTQEYDQRLKNAIEKNPNVDPLILKKRLMGSGPTVYQAILKKVEGLAPELQAVYNQAHDAADSADPATSAKGQKALQIFAQKYGIKP